MPRKKAESGMGRPVSLAPTPQQFDILAAQVTDIATHLKDVTKLLRENSMDRFTVQDSASA